MWYNRNIADHTLYWLMGYDIPAPLGQNPITMQRVKMKKEKEPKIGKFYNPADEMFPEMTLEEVEKFHEDKAKQHD